MGKKKVNTGSIHDKFYQLLVAHIFMEDHIVDNLRDVVFEIIPLQCFIVGIESTPLHKRNNLGLIILSVQSDHNLKGFEDLVFLLLNNKFSILEFYLGIETSVVWTVFSY